MEMSIQVPVMPQRRRRGLSCSLRRRVLLTTIAAAVLGVWISRAQRQQRIVAAIRELGGEVGYDFEFDSQLNWLGTAHEPSGPGGLCKILGVDCVDYYADVVFVRMGRTTTDAGLVHLATLRNLQGVYLWGPQITDTGLANLSGLSNLKDLYLSGTQITDAGLVHLATLNKLQDLELAETPITDAGLVHLSGLKDLEYLDVRETKVTDMGCEKLQEALPYCTVWRFDE